tara:strand:- start:213082 stop:213816 length:735 start_codon:yes stop_codon:yes gene_type:complete
MYKALITLCFSTVLISCSSFQTYDTSTAEGAFKQAEEYEKFERYDEAINHYQAVKNRFPYSRFAKPSDLKVADINFTRESYAEAQVAYQLYKEFYPRDQIADYVTFRIGMSYFNQLPDKIGRDQSLAKDAIRYFEELMDVYPQSSHIAKAKEHRNKALKKLAQKELYVADFYMKQEEYSSALGRYEEVLKKYSNIGFNKRALLGAVTSANRGKNERKAKQYLSRLAELAPGSKEHNEAQKELRR